MRCTVVVRRLWRPEGGPVSGISEDYFDRYRASGFERLVWSTPQKAAMARGKFNKRGGGPRLDAVNAEEIEIRNAQLAELEEARNARREEESDDEEEGDTKKTETATKKTEAAAETPEITSKPKKKEPEAPPAPVTTAADHKKNMARLAEVRRRREEAEARRKMEEEEETRMEEERKKMAAMTMEDSKSSKKGSKSKAIPKLDKITIKKMKPALLKEALKERDLDIQGTAKALQERLLKYEAAR